MLGRIFLPSLFLACAMALGEQQLQEIAAGVALFLFGMLCMEQGFKAYNGARYGAC